MNLKILFLILCYYSIFAIFLLLANPIFNLQEGYSGGIDLNQTGELTSSEIADGGLFTTGVNMGRFFSLITLGIGLPNTLPSWFVVMFMFWQTIMTILSVGFVVAMIWNG